MPQTLSASVALAGNPNVGKSTLFNALTGLRQHTGNWTGKTVLSAKGTFSHGGCLFEITDLPGAYSLFAHSPEEEVSRDYLLFGGADVTLVVADAAALERNLLLVLQVMEARDNVVLCVNLMDEAQKQGVSVDIEALRKALGIPVIAASAGRGEGIGSVREALLHAARHRSHAASPVEYPLILCRAAAMVESALAPWTGRRVSPRHLALRLLAGERELLNRVGDVYRPSVEEALERAEVFLRHAEFSPEDLRRAILTAQRAKARALVRAAVTRKEQPRRSGRWDALFTARPAAFLVMALLLSLLFYLTAKGANLPSAALQRLLFSLLEPLRNLLSALSLPPWLVNALIDGLFRTAAWVVAVMLPPMAIFFPLFTLLEDVGYLPRAAFVLDDCFRRTGGSGRQGLTMSMSLGCNACGVTGCRIIQSPRERLLALLTASFIPCNGRFPTLIALFSLLTGGSALFTAAGLASALCAAAAATLGVCALLSATVLKGQSTSFALEIPPFRLPRVGQVLVRSLLDRTLFVLGRAVAVAAPAGLILYGLANITFAGVPLLHCLARFLHPIGRLMGLSGAILLAFFLSFPANEILLPSLLMIYSSAGTLVEAETAVLGSILAQNGFSAETLVCTLLFSLFHFPCSTTCLTLYKETRSLRYTLLAAALPAAVGTGLCCAVHVFFLLFAGN